jgi:serine/threonine-protein kinase
VSLLTGQIIDGKYRIVREVGSGAMGAVYEGANVRIHRKVAIKVLLPSLAARADTVQRFEREAQAAGRIGSEHIVEVLDLGTLPDGSLYMVMEFLDGMTLTQRIHARGRVAPREITPIIQQLLTGLEAAHGARIIHRDLKPDNIFLCKEVSGQRDFVKILDFGVSKFNPLDSEMSMTTTGAVMGTPFYMSPEQAKGAKEIDTRSDLYSVGVIIYEAITGQKPFHAGTFNELIFKIVLETPAPPETFVPDIDPAFSRIVRRAMAREPNERYQSAKDLCDALSVWLHTGRDNAYSPLGPPPSRQPADWDEQGATRFAGGDPVDIRTVAFNGPSSMRQVMPMPSPAHPIVAAPAPSAGVPPQAPAGHAPFAMPADGYPPAVPPPPGLPPPGQSYQGEWAAEGWPAGVPGKRSRTPLVAGLAIAGALLTAGTVASLVFMSPGRGSAAATSSPVTAAETKQPRDDGPAAAVQSSSTESKSAASSESSAPGPAESGRAASPATAPAATAATDPAAKAAAPPADPRSASKPDGKADTVAPPRKDTKKTTKGGRKIATEL